MPKLHFRPRALRYNGADSGTACSRRVQRTLALHCTTWKDVSSVRKDAARPLEGCKTVNDSPEDPRLARCGARAITLYTRPGCHLCEEPKEFIQPMLSESRATLRDLNTPHAADF